MVTVEWLTPGICHEVTSEDSKEHSRSLYPSRSDAIRIIIVDCENERQIRLVKERKACYFDNRLSGLKIYEKQAARARKSSREALPLRVSQS
jgi:hypothetical protein